LISEAWLILLKPPRTTSTEAEEAVAGALTTLDGDGQSQLAQQIAEVIGDHPEQQADRRANRAR